MLSPVRSDAPSFVPPSASSVVGMPRAPRACGEHGRAIVCGRCAVRRSMMSHHSYCYFSSDSNVSVLRPKTWGGQRGPSNPVPGFYGQLPGACLKNKTPHLGPEPLMPSGWWLPGSPGQGTPWGWAQKGAWRPPLHPLPQQAVVSKL